MGKSCTIAFVFLIAFQANALAQTAHTECPDRPDDEASAKELAGQWFDKGTAMAQENRYEEAFLAFTCSVRMYEHPDTVYNAGQAARLAGNRNMALIMFRRYTAMVPDGHMAEQSKKSIEEIEAEIEEEREAAEEAAAKRREKAAAQAEAKNREKAAVDDRAGQKRRKTALKVSGVIAMGVGGATLLAGGTFQLLAGKAKSDAEDTHSFGEYQDFEDDMDTFQTVAIVGFVAGGVLAGTGIALLILGQDTETDRRVSLTPGPGSLLITGTF